MNAHLPHVRNSIVLLGTLVAGTITYAASITGNVTNKTLNKPSAGDKVVLVDVGAGMSDAATATTNSAGEYSLQAPGTGPYLIRVDHQGGTYFIAAPQGGGSGDVTVYDVAPKLDGVAIDANMLLVEAGGGTLRVKERYLVRNTSLPPRAQFSSNTFEIVLPDTAELDEASATRPGGLGTRTHLVALPQKQHYTFNVPIQPNQGEKETMFEVQYHLSYSGKYTFTLHPQMPADNVVIYAAKGIDFAPVSGASFHPTQEDPRVSTFVARNVRPGQDVKFTVSGEGQMPADTAGAGMQQTDPVAGGKPGGGLGVPIATPDPLTSSKGWILGGLALLLTGAAILLLRKRNHAAEAGADTVNEVAHQTPVVASRALSPQHGSDGPTSLPTQPALLNTLKEELFAIEMEKATGTISASEYDRIKTGLEAVLKRTLSGRPS
jgi:hypothetical protein